MQLEEFKSRAEETSLTEKQAEVHYRLNVMKQDRAAVACKMGCSMSNVDNLRRKATAKIAEARRTVRLRDEAALVALD